MSGQQGVAMKAEEYVVGPLSKTGWISISLPRLVMEWPAETGSPMAEMLRALVWPEPTKDLLLDLVRRLRRLQLSDDDCRSLLTMLSFLLEIRLGGDGRRHKELVNEVLTMLELEDSWIYQAGVLKGEEKAYDRAAKEERDKLIMKLRDAIAEIVRRRFGVDAAAEERIGSMGDPDQLSRLLVRLATAGTLTEALAG